MFSHLAQMKVSLVRWAIFSSLTVSWLSFWGNASLAEPVAEREVTFYVAPQGNDGWSGLSRSPDPEHRSGPWQTLAPLVHTLHQLGEKNTPVKVKIVCEPGRLELSEPINLQGLPNSIASLEFEAATPGSVLWSGGRLLTNWKPAREVANISPLLPQEARDHVFIADLKALGISDYGSAGGGGLELFYYNHRMTLGRWPNEGFTKILDVLGEQPVDVRGAKGDKVGKFIYEGDRPSRWLKEKDPWVHGYWFWDWSDQRHPIAVIDPSRSLIAVKPPYHYYGYRKGQWWYAFNLLSELDAPGEYYLDRETGQLYFWPPDSPTDAAQLEGGQPTVSVISEIIRLVSVKNVTLRGLKLAHCRGTALICENCENCTVENCEFLLTGGWAVQIREGRQCVVRQSHLHELGEGGVSARGGDRATLTPAGHVVEDNEIHHYGQIHPMYRAGVSIGGVGQHVLHNHIHHAPHQAVGFSGNNHTISWNEIDHVCLESNDAGAIYGGRDWTMRGTVISCNYFHHISGFQDRGCMGVYLDDMFCGTQIVRNIFYRVTRAAFIGGGRDNLVENNIFIDCRPAVHVDARGLGWASYHVPTTMMQRLKAVPYQSELWRNSYPALVNILEDEPAAPKGNIIRKNFCFGGTWANIENRARSYIVMENNVTLPLEATSRFFVNPEAEDWQLKPDAPV
ncbi:right-handed parallel beta-helix repeat-containing protein, partial [Thermogutta sp.]|uniref:right-handed parallel beta-helix repeat-containing protein n=1 Tax=Thermogutta sp. TaxID=1962930 RepID=UPI003C7EA44E